MGTFHKLNENEKIFISSLLEFASAHLQLMQEVSVGLRVTRCLSPLWVLLLFLDYRLLAFVGDLVWFSWWQDQNYLSHYQKASEETPKRRAHCRKKLHDCWQFFRWLLDLQGVADICDCYFGLETSQRRPQVDFVWHQCLIYQYLQPSQVQHLQEPVLVARHVTALIVEVWLNW